MIDATTKLNRCRASGLIVSVLLVIALVSLSGGNGIGVFAIGNARAQDETTSTDVATDQEQSEQLPADDSGTDADLPPDGEDTTNLESPPVEETDTTETEQEMSGDSQVEEDESTSGELPPVSDDGTSTESVETLQEATPDDAAPAPTLGYAPAGQPACTLSPGQPAQIASNSYIDYDCSFTVAFSGAWLSPADIQLDWSVQAAVDGGWAVQLLPPHLDPAIDTNWTGAQPSAQLFDSEGVWDAPSDETTESLDSTSEFLFGLRIHRALCSLDAQAVHLDLAVDATLPDLPGASVTLQGQQPDRFDLAPELAPIPEPSVAFTGPLDFGEIRMTTEGPVAPLQPAKSLLTVTGLDQACGSYELNVSSTPFYGPEDTDSTIGLALASVDDVALPGGDCAFADGCVIATLPAGPDAAPVVTFTLGVSLVLPAQPRAAVFDSSLTAALNIVTPDADTPDAAQPDSVDG